MPAPRSRNQVYKTCPPNDIGATGLPLLLLSLRQPQPPARFSSPTFHPFFVAGVSVSLLYADRDLLARIADARDRQRQAGAERAARLPARSLVTEASLRTDLANAKEQNRHLSEELVVLRDRLARELGAGADHFRGRPANPALDTLEERAAELETDNARLRQQVGQLKAGTSELADNLDAAREMNRELMNEVNRRAATLADPGQAGARGPLS